MWQDENFHKIFLNHETLFTNQKFLEKVKEFNVLAQGAVVHSEKSGKVSVLYMMSGSNFGRRFLDQLFEKEPQCLEQVTLPLLFSEIQIAICHGLVQKRRVLSCAFLRLCGMLNYEELAKPPYTQHLAMILGRQPLLARQACEQLVKIAEPFFDRGYLLPFFKAPEGAAALACLLAQGGDILLGGQYPVLKSIRDYVLSKDFLASNGLLALINLSESDQNQLQQKLIKAATEIRQQGDSSKKLERIGAIQQLLKILRSSAQSRASAGQASLVLAARPVATNEDLISLSVV